MLRYIPIVCGLLVVAGCSNFEPREKTAKYDPDTKQLVMPYPCPDWSQSQTSNYLNQPHSNFGCAVNTNAALQLDDPSDLHRGHGDARPDTGITTRVIEQYRAGDLPVPLTPIQDTGS
jgi:hypothetical protein